MSARARLKKRLLAKTPLRLQAGREQPRGGRGAARPRSSASAAASGWRWSAITAPARPRCCAPWPGSMSRWPGGWRSQGSIGSLIDPDAGMDQESTGRENIMLRALFRGMHGRRGPGHGRGGRAVQRPRRVPRRAGAHLFGRHAGAALLRHGHRHRAGGAADGRVVPGRRRRVHDRAPRSGWSGWSRMPISWCWPPTTWRSCGSGAPAPSGSMPGGSWPTGQWRRCSAE